MDFFARQDQARRNTHWLVLYFILATVLTVLLVYAICAALFLHEGAEQDLTRLWNFPLFGIVLAGTGLVILVGSLTKIAALSQGGAVVARELGGIPVDANTTDPDQKRLLNVVEEMALASGTPVPEVFLLPDEHGINAFAAGHSTQNAAIGVTQGCVQRLSRDELQGVIAHEFSHILNGDMRLNLRLIGIVHGLLCIAIVGRILLRSSTRASRRIVYSMSNSSRGKGGNPLPLLGLALIIVGSIGVFFGRLIKSAVSRQREFLADAAAVQFTRNPDGLAGALKKIGGLAQGSRITNPHAEEASHMFFGNGLRTSWIGLFSTHPPLIDRIRAIDPNFDGTFSQVGGEVEPAAPRRPTPPSLQPAPEHPRVVRPPQLADLLGSAAAAAAPPAAPRMLSASQVLDNVGAPTPNHLDLAIQLLAALPPNLAEAAHDPLEATCLVYAMALSREPAVRPQQLQLLEQSLDPPIHATMLSLLPAVTNLEPGRRLPVLSLALPALRRLSQPQYEQFFKQVRLLIEADRQVDLFEFALQKMLLRHLAPQFHGGRGDDVRYQSLRPLLPEATRLLQALALHGHSDRAQADHAFQHGLNLLAPGLAAPIDPAAGSFPLAELDSALNRLAEASAPIKKRVLEACVATVAADGRLQLREAELLRAIADSLGCPIPPFLS